MFIPGSLGNVLPRATLPKIQESVWYPDIGPPSPLAFSPDPTDIGVNLGVMFSVSLSGDLLSICYWRWSALQASNGTIALWSCNNELSTPPVLIASQNFTGHTGTGWKKVDFVTPIPVSAAFTYKASIWIPESGDGNLYYGGTPAFFFNKTYYSPNRLITAYPNTGQPFPPHGIYKRNGHYKYGAFACPDDQFGAGSYWIDIVLLGSPSVSPPDPPVVLKWAIPPGYPNLSNTGVPPGTVLTPIYGDIGSEADGQIFENLDILDGGINIAHQNCIVRKCRIYYRGLRCIGINFGCLGTIIEDCDLNSGFKSNPKAAGVSGSPLRLRRCNIYRGENGVAHYGSYGDGSVQQIFEDNFIHNLRASPDEPHYDCMQFNGGQGNLVIRHNTLHNENTDTSAILIENANGAISGIRIEDNIMCGGGYTSYCVGRRDDPLDAPVSVQYYNNQLRIGNYGYIIDTATTPLMAGNRFMDHGGIYDFIPPEGFTNGQMVRERFFGMPNGPGIVPGSIVYDAVPGITLGVSFTMEQDSTIVGVNFPKMRTPGETLTYKVGVWRFTGANRNAGTTLLYQETIPFLSGQREGWEHLSFTSSVNVTAGQNILVGLWCPPGADGKIWFSSVGGVFGDNVDSQFGRAKAFNGAGVPYNGFTGGNGLYNYGSDLVPPLNQTSGRPSYNIDPIFEAPWAAVNEPPEATNLSTAESYALNTPLNLSDIVVSDIDSPNVTVTLTMSNPSAGSLSTATSGPVTSTYSAGVWTASGPIVNVNTLLLDVIFTPATGFNSDFSIATSVSDGVALPITGTKPITFISGESGTIPLFYNDIRFSTNVSSEPVTMSSGTLFKKSITETGGSASILATNMIIIDTCRVDSRECVRVAGSGVDIRNSYLESTGQDDDHADTIQAYSPGEVGSHIMVTDSSIVAHTVAATAGLFVADGWSGTVTLNNVVFNGGPYGCRIHADAGCTVYVSLTDVFFVGPFAWDPFLIEAAGGTLIITHWENVRNATIVDGVLVPGSILEEP